jgi:anaerobic ribonucleoside-triphosphate reductase activating protein
MNIQVAGRIQNSNANGDGMRYVLFVSGCKQGCDGCHNKDMQNYHYGDSLDIEEIFEDIKYNASILDGVTFSGGEPFDKTFELTALAQKIKSLGLNIWCYTGYIYEDLLEDTNKNSLLKEIDVLIDGPFVKEKQEGALKYTGSSNQRIIKLQDTI